jgi:AcrR family transcriptional regulator
VGAPVKAPILDSGEAVLPRQARSIERRAKLIDAARALFSEKGYEATSIDDIATRAGTAVGAFYNYFRSKRQLLIVLMNELLEKLAAVDLHPKSAKDVQQGLREFLAEVFKADLEYYGVIRAWQEATLADAELAEMQRTIETWTERRILRVFQLLQKMPRARKGHDLAPFARMMDRHFWSMLARGASATPRTFHREVRVAADVIYHYLFLG